MSDGNPPTALEKARAMAESLGSVSGGAAEAIVLYGSHLLQAQPDRHSALDLLVVVSDYRAFYQALHSAGEIHRSVRIMTALSRVLPPNVIAYTPGEGERGVAKCLVVSRAHLAAGLGERPKDHFLLGRLVQKVAIVWAAGPDQAAAMERALEKARASVLTWIGPYLDERFDAEGVGRRILEVCYRGELRPEARDRASTIFETQREHFREGLAPVLEAAAEAGVLARVEDGYRLVRPVPDSERRRWDRYFRRSKVRATARWFKHVITFDNWLPYVHRKAERRLGTTIELTRLERRWPLIFLWPKAYRAVFIRPDREGGA